MDTIKDFGMQRRASILPGLKPEEVVALGTSATTTITANFNGYLNLLIYTYNFLLFKHK